MGDRRQQIKDELAENLKRLRKRKGLTQNNLADQIGCTSAYVSKLEKGACAASMTILKKLSAVLEVSVTELLSYSGALSSLTGEPVKAVILNDPSSKSLLSPINVEGGRDGFLMPSVRARDSFALYLPDESMSPEFDRGDLVVFSHSRKPTDGDACLVDDGKGQILFRTVWALPGGGWGLKANHPRYEPQVVKGKGVKLWPAVGHWRKLGEKRRGK